MASEAVRQMCRVAIGMDTQDQYDVGRKSMAESVLAALNAPEHPSDPKHLPPRDCLVLLDIGEQHAWVTARHMTIDKCWASAETFRTIDPSRVITWRELPEVE